MKVCVFVSMCLLGDHVHLVDRGLTSKYFGTYFNRNLKE